MNKDIVTGSQKVICVRVNPNSKKLKGTFAGGPEMVRFVDALGRGADLVICPRVTATAR